MPNKRNSEKVTDKPFEFLKFCIEKNMELAYEDGEINPVVYDFMGGLAKLGKHIDLYQGAFPDRKYSIYSSYYRPFDNSFEGKIFYFVDDLGLISAYVIGPDLGNEKEIFFGRRSLFFGHKLGMNETNTNIFGCFQDYEKGIESPVEKVDLKKLLSDFLPLPSDKWNRVNKYNSSARDYVFSRGSESNNNLILQTDKRTFFIPFDELVRPKIGNNGSINVYGKPEENYFEISVYKKTRMRKYELTESWKGKVSYDKFDLLELEFVDKDYYNTW
jgi:hypothetical protein